MSATREKFPLWLHPSGQWCKKSKGRFYYFGTDKEAALKEFVRVWDDLKAGRTPPAKAEDALTLTDLVNVYLTHKKGEIKKGEFSLSGWKSLRIASESLLERVGKGRTVESLKPKDFISLGTHLSERYAPASQKINIAYIKSLFNFAFDNDLIPAPVRFGDALTAPSQKAMRLEKDKKPAKLLSAGDIRKLLSVADPCMKALILLGLNGALGASDLARLTFEDLEKEPGWIVSLRNKTAAKRRIPLWGETVAAIDEARKCRPQEKSPEHARTLFITARGLPLVTVRENCVCDSVSKSFHKLAKTAGVKLPKGSGFYCLRHVFRTAADELSDRRAIDRIMGHSSPSDMSSHYVERIDDMRLLLVVEHVHDWLFSATAI